MTVSFVDVGKDIQLSDNAFGIVITRDKIYISLDGGTLVDFDISAIEGAIKIEERKE